MNNYRRLISILAIFCSCLFCMLNTDAAARATTHTRAIQPELIKQTLELAAFPSEIVSLKHIPAFPQGLLIPEVQEQPVLIGFPAQGLRPGNLFFLQAGKRSGLLQWDAARRSIIYYGSSNGTLPQHVLDFVECLLNVVDTFLNEIDACGDDQFCYLGPLIEMTVDIPLCILDIF